jgi:AraC family L-rhamnose operon transcriptional activator RhaR
MKKIADPDKLEWDRHHPTTRRVISYYVPNHLSYPIHDHEFVEIAVIKGGTCLHRSAIGECHPKSGDVFLMRPGAWHGYSKVRNLSLYNCCFESALLGRELAWMVNDPALSRMLWGIPLSPKQHGMLSLRLSGGELAQCCALLDSLAALSQEDYQSHHGDHVGLLTQILSLLARSIPPSETAPLNKPHRAVTEALKWIDHAPSEDWTLARLAELVQVERTYLVRLFRAALGIPPMAYIIRRRLEISTQLLRRPDLSIGEAGAMAGWLDRNYFSRSFRQHFGMTPSEYRARFREGLSPE